MCALVCWIKNEDGQMTIEEYQFSGQRSFNRWDSDKNDLVSMSEALPEARKNPELQSSSAQVVAVNE